MVIADNISVKSQKGRSEAETELLWQILDHFFSAAYWRRVWVIQEIAVAPNVTILLRGTEARWEDIAEVISELRKVSVIGSKHHNIYRNAFHILEFRTRFKKREFIGILDALRLSGHTLATDPRDKIFALLGLCHDGSAYVPLPNYKQPLEIVITDMVRTMMSTNHSLDLMCLKGAGHPSKSTLPSWVPDLTSFWSGSVTIQEATFGQWQTTNSLNPILEGSNSRILKVKGKLLGIVGRLSTGMKPDEMFDLPDTSRNPWISQTSKMGNENPAIRSASEGKVKLRDRIWETITMGLLRGLLSSDKLRGCFSALWTPMGRGAVHNLALIAWIDQNAFFRVQNDLFKLKSPTLRQWSQTKSSAEQEVVRWQDDGNLGCTAEDFETFITFLEAVLASGMRLAVFETDLFSSLRPFGPYLNIGMVHPHAEPRDQVFFLQGCAIPVVLRPVEREGSIQYQVIGGAYVLDADKQYEGFDPKISIWDGTGTEFPYRVDTLDLI